VRHTTQDQGQDSRFEAVTIAPRGETVPQGTTTLRCLSARPQYN